MATPYRKFNTIPAQSGAIYRKFNKISLADTFYDISTDIRALTEIPITRDIDTDIRAKGAVEEYDIDTDIRTRILALYDISNDIRTTNTKIVTRDIFNDVRVKDEIPVFRDIKNDIRCRYLVFKDIANDIRVAKGTIIAYGDIDTDVRAFGSIPVFRDINNDIRAMQEERHNINNDIRYRISSSITDVVERNISIQEGGYISSQNVTVLMDVLNAIYMRFQNDVNIGTWSSWEDFDTVKSWTLSAGDGNKKVYIQFKDAAGKVTAGDTYAEAVLDTSNPIMTTIQAYTEEGGSAISDSVYQTDRSPYFEWLIPVFSATIVGYKYTMDNADMGTDINMVQPQSCVENGLEVGPNSGMRIQANSGYYYDNGIRIYYDSGTALLDNGGVQDRIDLIYLDTLDNILRAVKGTESATPIAPTVPASAIYLADIYIEAGETLIVSGDITDKRLTKIKLKTYESERLSAGQHILRVRAQGANGNWSNTTTFNLYVSSDSPDIGEIECWRDNTKIIQIADASYQTADNTPYFEWPVPVAPSTMTYYYTWNGTEPTGSSSNTSNNYLDYVGSPFSAGTHVLTVKAKDSFGTWGKSRKFIFIYGTLDLSSELSVVGNSAILRQSQKEIHIHKVEFSLRSARICEFEEVVAFDADVSFAFGETVAVIYSGTTVFRGKIIDIQRGLDIGQERVLYRAVGPRAELTEEFAFTVDAELGETSQLSYEDKSPQYIIDDILSKFPKIAKLVNTYPTGANLTIELINMTVDQALQAVYDKCGHFGFYFDVQGVFHTVDLNSVSSIDAYFGVYGQKISAHSEYNILNSDLEIDVTNRYNKIIIEGNRRRELITVPAIWSNPLSSYPYWEQTGHTYLRRQGEQWEYNITHYIPQTNKKIVKLVSWNVNYMRALQIGWAGIYPLGVRRWQMCSNNEVSIGYFNRLEEPVASRDSQGGIFYLAHGSPLIAIKKYPLSTPSLTKDGLIRFSNPVLTHSISGAQLVFGSPFDVFRTRNMTITSGDVWVTLLVEVESLRVEVFQSGTADAVARTRRIYNSSFNYNEDEGVDDTSEMIDYANSLLAESKDIKLSGKVTLDTIDTNWNLAKTVNLQNANPSRGWDSINAKITSVTWDFDANNTIIELTTEYLGG